MSRSNPIFLGEHFASRDPAHICRWLNAMAAGRAKRQCVALARATGERCRRHSLKFSDKCTIHCTGSERIAVDEKRLKWLERRSLRNFNAAQKARIETSIARIHRRRLRWVWRTMDPTLPGSTIELTPRDLERVHHWLRHRAGVDPDELTARALDRCTWAAALFLARRSTEETALKSVKIALRDEERWRAKTCGDEAWGSPGSSA
jgi:hypothetical protein